MSGESELGVRAFILSLCLTVDVTSCFKFLPQFPLRYGFLTWNYKLKKSTLFFFRLTAIEVKQGQCYFFFFFFWTMPLLGAFPDKLDWKLLKP